ncbi:hypothetical protein JTB14_029713 [Gonioctena quinquepunctata]|nr:hypothetical protein JTB14_029713 [Gonioctena quinquepunctata]
MERATGWVVLRRLCILARLYISLTLFQLVFGEDKTFKVLLTTFIAKITNNDSVEPIRSIRNIKEGKLLLIMDKTNEALESISEALEDGNTLSTRGIGKKPSSVLHFGNMLAKHTRDVERAL